MRNPWRRITRWIKQNCLRTILGTIASIVIVGSLSLTRQALILYPLAAACWLPILIMAITDKPLWDPWEDE